MNVEGECSGPPEERTRAPRGLVLAQTVRLRGPPLVTASCYCFLSYGAPVPDDPTNSFRPSARVTRPPLAIDEPFFAWYPSTITSVPTGSVFLFHPRLRS